MPEYRTAPAPILATWHMVDLSGRMWHHAVQSRLRAWVADRDAERFPGQLNSNPVFRETGIPYGYRVPDPDRGTCR